MGKIRDQGLSEGYSTQIDWVKGVSKVRDQGLSEGYSTLKLLTGINNQRGIV